MVCIFIIIFIYLGALIESIGDVWWMYVGECVIISVCLRRNGLVGGYIYSLILGLMFAVGFPFWEWDENFINYFFGAEGSPYFKRSSAEFSVEFRVLG